jgi:hypothetical protein
MIDDAVKVYCAHGWAFVEQGADGIWTWQPHFRGKDDDMILFHRDTIIAATRETLEWARQQVSRLEDTLSGLEAQPPWDPETWELVPPPFPKDRDFDRSIPVGHSPPSWWRPRREQDDTQG